MPKFAINVVSAIPRRRANSAKYSMRCACSFSIWSVKWSLIERNRTMQMAPGEELFDIYEGRVLLNQQEYIIPVVASLGIPEPLLGLQWLKMLPLGVNFLAGILKLG